MKKLLIVSAVAMCASGAAFASDYIPQETSAEVYTKNYYKKTVADCNASSIRRELDKATAYGRAVVTVIECEAAPKPAPRKAVQIAAPACNDCNPEFEVVTNRKYFVKETREVFKPVVSYVSAGAYTTTREVCGNEFCGR
ncbi:MAG: hypothetical protein LBJ18_04380 [Rickettsiales bacterium]|jgi:hypothetical protein|nr:hypothetical protein [Rickettsiales bacterium]